MNKAYLLMGGNIGDTLSSLKQSISILAKTYGTILQQSRVYKTAPWGKTDQQEFLNQAVVLETSLTANELLRGLLQIEEQMGRKRLEKYGPRVMDIDILLFNDFVIKEPGLTIPHPQLQYRRFALAPLNEIAPSILHPVLNKTIRELLRDCQDQLEVSLLE